MGGTSEEEEGRGPGEASSQLARFPILNPVDPSELLTSVDADECFILPSAHFPLLLCFNSEDHPCDGGSPRAAAGGASPSREGAWGGGGGGVEQIGDVLYRTKVEIMGLRSSASSSRAKEAFVVQGMVAGVIQESGVR